MRKKRVLLVVNDLNYTGAPVFLFSVARVLKSNNYSVEVWSCHDGPLKKQLQTASFTVDIIEMQTSTRLEIVKKSKSFDVMIAFTILTYEIVDICKNIVPTIWYIHERQNLEEYLQNERCRRIFEKNKLYWTVSEYANDYIEERWGKETTIIHNFVPDEGARREVKNTGRVKKFLLLGNMIELKGYDIFFKAFDQLSVDDKNACELHYAGDLVVSDYAGRMKQFARQYDNIIDHGTITEREELWDLYEMCDVVVVPSRDESCSLVTLEATMMSKPVIVTENVGAKYIVSSDNGWIIPVNNTEKLKKIFHDVINNQYDLQKMGRCSREKYLMMATERQYRNRFFRLLKKTMPHNRTMWKICHFPLYVYSEFINKYIISPCPQLDINRGSKVVLYGAGKNGQKWKSILGQSCYFKIVAWVDKYTHDESVCGIDSLKEIQYDYIIVTVKKMSLRMEIENDLIQMEIQRDKLFYLD